MSTSFNRSDDLAYGADDLRDGGCRTMQQRDLKAVCAIEQQAYEFPWSKAIFLDCLRADYRCQVALCGADIVGYAIVSTGAGEAHVLNLCVAPDWRRRGYARRLLRQALRLAREDAAETLFLEVRPSNHGARKLYEDFGFCEIGMRPNYYPADQGQGREDAIIMGKSLAAPSRL